MKLLTSLLLLFLTSLTIWAESAHGLTEKGNIEFQNKNYEKALEYYNQASEEFPHSSQLAFNRGSAYYRMEQYVKAIEEFKKSALESQDFDFSAQAKFNLGNCVFQQAKQQGESDLEKSLELCRESIKYFQDARDFKVNYQKAAENIEVVKLYMKVLLDNQQKQQEQQEQQDQEEENLVTKLKKLLERQKTLITENKAVNSRKPQEPTRMAPPALQKVPVIPEPKKKSTKVGDIDISGDPAIDVSEEPTVNELAQEQLRKQFIAQADRVQKRNTFLTSQYESYLDSLKTFQKAHIEWKNDISSITTEQQSLVTDTQAIATEIEQTAAQLAQQANAPTDPSQPANPQLDSQITGFTEKLGKAGQHVADAISQETSAGNWLVESKLPEALPFQTQATRDIEEAIQALNEDQEEQQDQDDQENNEDNENQDQQDKQDQQDGENSEEDQNQDENEKENDESEGENEDSQDQQDQQNQEGDDSDEQQDDQSEPSEEDQEQNAEQLENQGESPDDILDEERQIQKQLRPIQGRLQRVDKDW